MRARMRLSRSFALPLNGFRTALSTNESAKRSLGREDARTEVSFMRRVHWSVWGFVGFFSMMLLGLWVDSRWLFGVGAKVRLPHATVPVPVTQVQAVVPEPCDEGEPAADALEAEPLAPEGPQATVGLSAPGVIGGGLDIPLTPSPELLPPPEVADMAVAVDEPLDLTGCSFMRLAIPVGPVEVSAQRDEPATEESGSSAPAPTERNLKHDEQKAPAAKEPAAEDDANGSFGFLRELQEQHSTVLRSPAFAPDAESKAEILRTGTDVWRQQQQADREAARLDPPPRPPQDFASAPPRPEPAPITSAEQVEALRAAAQKLDEIANHLERQNLYPRADQLRGMAQEMRV